MDAAFRERSGRIRASPAARRAAWKAGVLWWLLDEHQYRAYTRIRAAMTKPFARFVLRWARRTGKTHVLLVVAIEECLRHAGHRYNIAAATKESLAEFVWPAIHYILETCPDELRPWIREARGRVIFRKPRGQPSYMVLAGCNDSRSVERLRGPKSNGNILEEIGAIPDAPGLGYIQAGILNPQLLTTGGWTLQAGTPPRSSGHEAAAIFLRAQAERENYSYATLYDNPRLSPTEIQAYLTADAAALGMSPEEYKASADYRREWLALVETDPTYAVLPECTPERLHGMDGKPAIIREMPDVPMFRDRYEGMDLGFHPHFTAVLFAYWDFSRRVLVVEEELLEQRLNDTRLAEMIGGRKDEQGTPLPGEEGVERRLWGSHQPYMRVADNNYPMTLSELAVVHGLVFTPTPKHEKEAAILHVRRWVREGKLAVHPRCKRLIAQLGAAVWNKARTEFAEVKGFGHFDAVDALIYLVRSVVPNQDRMPPGWGVTQDAWTSRRIAERQSAASRALSQAFGDN